MRRVPINPTVHLEFVFQKAAIGYFDENLDVVGAVGLRVSIFDLPLIGGYRLVRAARSRYLRPPDQPAVLFGLAAFPRGIDNDVRIALTIQRDLALGVFTGTSSGFPSRSTKGPAIKIGIFLSWSSFISFLGRFLSRLLFHEHFPVNRHLSAVL